jgi:formylglycine-generating enzyme required for sulfatase activity
VAALVWEATEVTVERYAAWLATLPAAEQVRRVPREAGVFGAVGRPLWERRDGRFVPPKADLQKPIDSISLHDARAFALAEGRRLPTAQEWAWAATGPFGAPCALGALERLFGDVACVGPEARGPRGVGTSPGDVSLFGLHDLAGNVAELTATLTTRSGETGWLVLGSGYGLAPERGRAASAVAVPGWMPLRGVGFRLVMDPP